MIKASNLSLRRGAKELFTAANFSIFPGQRVGVVGRNGCGKSSLFALLGNRLQADAGDFSIPKAWDIAELEQHVPSSELSALEFCKQGDLKLAAIERAMVDAHDEELGELQMHYAELDGYRLEARAGELLNGMGFSAAEQQQVVNAFSGGWRMRLKLVQTLMRRADLLLLDEPTNHLDLDAVLWFGEWLKRFPGTLMLISHDRDFLDQVCTHILHLDGASATLYAGNFSAFARQRVERMAQAEAQAQQLAQKRAHLQSFVDRFRAKASKARQAQSRIKMLERMGEAPAPRAADHIDLPTPMPKKLPTPLIKLIHADVGYEQTAIVRGIHFTIEPGERIGVLGRNGAGKSTLMKLIGGGLSPMQGERFLAPDTIVRHFTQFEVEALPADRSPIELLRDAYPEATSQGLRDWLGAFKYGGDLAVEPIGPRSGGEKARFVLARMLYGSPNLLLLDEPTNHLDMEMREALAESLTDFPGAVVMVAHDRALLESTCDQFLVVADARVEAFSGDLDDYAQWLKARRTAAGKQQSKPVARSEAKKDNSKRRQELSRAEQDLANADQQFKRLDRQMLEKLEAGQSGAQLKTLQAELERARIKLAAAEEAWLKLADADA